MLRFLLASVSGFILGVGVLTFFKAFTSNIFLRSKLGVKLQFIVAFTGICLTIIGLSVIVFLFRGF